MQQDIKKGFEESGYNPDIQPLAFFQDDYGLKPKEGEDEGEDDIDEEGSQGSGSDSGSEED